MTLLYSEQKCNSHPLALVFHNVDQTFKDGVRLPFKVLPSLKSVFAIPYI